jgi:hypothetical protein
MPAAAAVALASLIAAGPPGPCRSINVGATAVMVNEPPSEPRRAPSRVTGSAVDET